MQEISCFKLSTQPSETKFSVAPSTKRMTTCITLTQPQLIYQINIYPHSKHFFGILISMVAIIRLLGIKICHDNPEIQINPKSEK